MQGGKVKSAFSLVEVVVVVAILAILFAIGVTMAGPALEDGRRATCASQIRQIFVASHLYSSDYDSRDRAPELEGVPSIQGDIATALAPYGMTRDMWFCPSSSQDYLQHLVMTYGVAAGIVAQGPDDKIGQRAEAAFLAIVKKMGGQYPIILCPVHDQFYYWPSDPPDKRMKMAPWFIWSDVYGSIHSGRLEGYPRVPPYEFHFTKPPSR